MELRQLEYFVYVAEEENFTRAAAKAHTAQPGVSAQIQRLERELGEALFDRTKRVVRLTDAGATLLPYARAALAAVADGRLALDEIRGLIRGRVNAGLMATLPSIDVAGLLSTFHHSYPTVQITLAEAGSERLVEQLDSGHLDVAIIGLPGPPPTGIQTRPIRTEELVVATSRHDPLAARSSIPVAALKNRQLISLPPGSGLRAFLNDACTHAGFDPDIAIEAGDPHLLVQLTARGLGVSVLPRSIADTYPEQLHTLTLTGPRLRGQIALAWKPAGPHNPAARRFIRHAQDLLTTHDREKGPAAAE